jgi:DNA (cytosine-5)-methyltransferase 1
MLTPQYLLGLNDELVVDLFAGGGGASCGIEQAIGRTVDIAVNHDPEAVSLHQANHPQTRHFVSDVFEVDPRVVTDGQPVGMLWASPDCTFHSKARGGKPHRDRNKARRRRGLAWVVCRWAREVRPRVIALENVEEFQHWGPLLADGTPCPDRRGSTFQRWVAQLRNLGYAVQWRELRACDYGAPTIRKRLFLVARCDGQPIVWPEPTHAAKPARGSGLQPWRTAADCIDWSIPCPSIFERERPLADATLRRIAHGVMRYVVNAAEPYIVRIGQTGHSDAGKVRPVNAPLSTVTTKAEHLLVAPALATIGYGERAGQAPRVQDPGAPLGTIVGANKHALVAAFLAKHYTGVVGSDLRAPVGTVTTQDHHSLVAPLLIDSAHSDVSPSGVKRWSHGNREITKPGQTVVASGGNAALVSAFLSAYYGSDQDTPVDDPMHTVTTKPRFALVTVEGQRYAIADIGMRMLQPRELYAAQGFPPSYVIDRGADGRPLSKAAQVRMCGNSVCPPLAAAIVRANYAERQAQRAAA